jgi:hypothetical protein
MPCLATLGRLEPCKEFVGGLYKVWFANFGFLTGMTINVNNQISAMSAVTIYEYELKGTSKLTQELTSSRENGTTFVTQTLTLDLKGGDFATNNEIKLLAYGRPHIFVQDNYGNTWCVGRVRGTEITTATHDTGAALGDKYGYTLTAIGTEKEFANWVSGSTIALPFGSITTQPTIVKGT